MDEINISVGNLEFAYEQVITQYLALGLIFSYNKLLFFISHHQPDCLTVSSKENKTIKKI